MKDDLIFFSEGTKTKTDIFFFGLIQHFVKITCHRNYRYNFFLYLYVSASEPRVPMAKHN